MLEIFLEGDLTYVDITIFLKWMESFKIPFDVNNAPHRPKKIFSSYVEASHRQTGIWDMPLPEGHLRLLMSKGKYIGPQSGQCSDRKMVAVSEDNESLCYIALHELGHALNVVDTKREVVLKIKTKPEFTNDARSEKDTLVDRMSVLHPDGLIEFGGLHCLSPGCIMQPCLPPMLSKDPSELFCQACKKRLYKYRDKLLSLAAEVNTCLYCQDIHQCMFRKSYIWEGSPVCKKFNPIAKEDSTE